MGYFRDGWGVDVGNWEVVKCYECVDWFFGESFGCVDVVNDSFGWCCE